MRMCVKDSTSKASLEGVLYGHTRIAVERKKTWIGLVLPVIPKAGVVF